MAYADPDDIRNVEKKYLVRKNLIKRYLRVQKFIPGQLASLMTAYFIKLVEQAEDRAMMQSKEFCRRSQDVIRAH